MFYTLPKCCLSADDLLVLADVDTSLKLKDHAFTSLVKLVSVYDGDTIWVAYYDRRFKRVMRVSCRMEGYDAPEMKPPKNAPNRDSIISNAKRAKQIVEQHYPKGCFRVRVVGTDKYGRWLVRDPAIKDKLLNLGLAYEYNGGKKIENFEVIIK